MDTETKRAVDREILYAPTHLGGFTTYPERKGVNLVPMEAVAMGVAAFLPGGPVKAYPSFAALPSDADIGTLAYADGKAWRKTASGWVQFLDFIPGSQMAFAVASATEGTPNAIKASPNIPVSSAGKQLVVVVPRAANTSSPVTVDFGFGPLTIKTANGNNVEAGGLTPAPKLGFVSGNEFRLLSDVAPESLLPAAEAAAAAAQNARDDANAAASAIATAPQWAFATKATAALFNPVTTPAQITVDGLVYDYAPAGNPGHDGYVMDAGNHFYVLHKTPIVNAEAFRDVIDFSGVTDSSSGMTKALAYMSAQGGGKLLFPREAQIFGRIADIPANTEVDFNWSKLIPPNGLNNIVQAVGSLNATRKGLFTGTAQNDTVLQISGSLPFAVGDDILIFDNTPRLTDAATMINMEVRRVVAIAPGSPNLVYVDKPLGFKKDAIAGDGIAKINWKTGVKLINLHTEASTGALGNAGVYLQFCKDAEVWGRRHRKGVAAANDFRTCLNLRGGQSDDRDIVGASHYHSAFNQGSRDCLWDGQEDDGARHAVDFDSADGCRVINAVSHNSSSTPFVLSHNGTGRDLYVQGEVYNGPDATGGYGFVNTRGWKSVTGQGANEASWPLIGLGCKVRGVQKRKPGAANEDVGVYMQQPIRDMDIDVNIICGDGVSYPPGVTGISCGVRLYQVGNSGQIRMRRVRGYATAIGSFSDGVSTAGARSLEVSIDDADWCNYVAYLNNSTGMDFRRVVTGSNIQNYLFHIDSATGYALQSIGWQDVKTPVAATKFIEASGSGLGIATGYIGSIATPETIATKTVAANFTLTRSDVLATGRNPIRIDATAACSITAIEAGMFVGQTITLWSATSATFAVTISSGATNVTIPSAIQLGLRPVTLIWTSGAWRQQFTA